MDTPKSRTENFAPFCAQPQPLAFSGSTVARDSRPTRRFHRFSKKKGKMPDCVAERGGFEPPRPFRIRGTEFGPSLAHYSPRIKASVLERISSPWIRLCFGSLRFPSFGRMMRGIWRH